MKGWKPTLPLRNLMDVVNLAMIFENIAKPLLYLDTNTKWKSLRKYGH
jgi:hypothetical protein